MMFSFCLRKNGEPVLEEMEKSFLSSYHSSISKGSSMILASTELSCVSSSSSSEPASAGCFCVGLPFSSPLQPYIARARIGIISHAKIDFIIPNVGATGINSFLRLFEFYFYLCLALEFRQPVLKLLNSHGYYSPAVFLG